MGFHQKQRMPWPNYWPDVKLLVNNFFSLVGPNSEILPVPHARFRVLRSTTTPPHSLKVIEGISIFKSKMVNKSFILAHKACFVNSSEGKSICMEISNNKVSGTAAVRAAGNKIKSKNLYETVREKTNNLGFQPGPTQTGLYKHRRWLETGNFGFRKMRNCTIRVAKTKALISFAVTAKLICVFVFAYADCCFFHGAAHIKLEYQTCHFTFLQITQFEIHLCMVEQLT